MSDKVLEYFGNDILASSVWQDKYQLKDRNGNVQEETPTDMHWRLAKEFARVEFGYIKKEANKTYKENTYNKLSDFGKYLITKRTNQTLQNIEQEFFNYFDKFNQIVPQGSIMSNLGNFFTFGSLSNCFGIASPYDSYGGIMRTDEHIAQLEKRRGGVGVNISTLRNTKSLVSNTSKTSTGIIPYAERYSNTTREVAQDGRRGALMILLMCQHPDIFRFVSMKDDRTKVTGANVSVMFTDEFMYALENNQDFYCRFPVDVKFYKGEMELFKLEAQKNNFEYNKVFPLTVDRGSIMRIKPSELFDLVAEMAWKNAEPGVAYYDRVVDYSPEGVYEQYKARVCNPCFHPDTLISTVNGEVKIKDITMPTKVYSMNEQGQLVIKSASASFVSKKNTETLIISIDNGKSITVTPNHKLFVRTKGWVEAKDIQLGDVLEHLVRGRRGACYSGVRLTTEKRIAERMEHRFRYEQVFGKIPDDYDLHHKDEDTYNNSINNLELLFHNDHAVLTATTQNPQTHQVTNETGRFITHENSNKGRKVIKEISSSLRINSYYRSGAVRSITTGETTDVYDITVEDTHCLIANGIVAHNCGEQWFAFNETCRLIALNFLGIVKNHFETGAEIDYDLLYEMAYMQQRLGDNLVDLECEYIDRILKKILSDPEPIYVKNVEYQLWQDIQKIAREGRRTGGGFTALGDMLAALNLKYDSDAAINTIKKVMRVKMRAELDCTIDMAILRGPFVGWEADLEFDFALRNIEDIYVGRNSFFKMLWEEFPEQAKRMIKYGRRNTNWSTVAPTGTVSLMTQTTSGLEPLFKAYYIRRKKINPSEQGVRIDFTDQNGDNWQEFAVLHPKFKEWINNIYLRDNHWSDEIAGHKFTANFEDWTKEDVAKAFKNSPWYKSEADDISWEKRIDIQAIIQKYTSNAISSTINLPKDVPLDTVKHIYLRAYHRGLKGVTVYRDTSRTGVLVHETKTPTDNFGYTDAIKRPKELDAHYHPIKIKGKLFAVIIGLLNDKPYELFAFDTPLKDVELKGKVTKLNRGEYLFRSEDGNYIIENVQLTTEHTDEKLLTRMCSQLLRHGVNPKHIVEQVEKSEVTVVSFAKAIVRVLKRYIPDEETKSDCPNCKGGVLVYEEGCKKCNQCGYSAC